MGDLNLSFTRDDVIIESRETVYQGFFRMEKLRLSHKTFDGQMLGPFTRELFTRGEAVCVLLYDPDHDEVVLTEQFRVGALEDERSPWLLELVAGMVEDGESYEDVARRESEEESGCTPLSLIPICRYWVSPGGTDERVAIYCGLIDSGNAGGVHGLIDEHEDIRVHRIAFAHAWQAVSDGTIDNAATIMAIQWLKIHHDRIRNGRFPDGAQPDWARRV